MTIRLAPSEARAYDERARIWVSRKEFDKALADLDTAIQLAPQAALPYFDRADVWEKRGRYDRAIDDYGKAIRIDPEFPYLYGAIASLGVMPRCRVCATVRKPSTRQARLRIDRLEGGLSPRGTRGVVSQESGDFDAAVDWQKQAIAIEPGSTDRPQRRQPTSIFIAPRSRTAPRPAHRKPGTAALSAHSESLLKRSTGARAQRGGDTMHALS